MSDIKRYNQSMTDSLGDLLADKGLQEPPEIKIIKDYVQDQFKVDVHVAVGPKQILILVPSAALAGALRMQLHQLQQLCQTDKKLVIRIN